MPIVLNLTNHYKTFYCQIKSFVYTTLSQNIIPQIIGGAPIVLLNRFSVKLKVVKRHHIGYILLLLIMHIFL